MIKKISTSELEIGMYIHDLDCGWMEHPFFSSKFLVKNMQTIQKIASAGIRNVYIDPSLGKDIIDLPTQEDISQSLQTEMEQLAEAEPAQELSVPAAREAQRARVLFREATTVIHNLMGDARLGKQVEIEALKPMTEKMIQSVFRNPHAITGISRIKTKDEYTFMHCVSFAGLMIAFAKEVGLNEQEIMEVAIGSLLHDIGKTMIPDEILNKPGKLTPEEFEIMKSHVIHSQEILQDSPGLSQNSLDVAMMHHERMDGNGYPFGLKGDEISLIGKMSAIVDVYDALTSVRVYKDAWQPTHTLKKILEWSPDHFSKELVQKFILCLGIYPVGSLVELESGLVGIVTDQTDDMLRPQLRIVYNARRKSYAKVQDIDLSKMPHDRILAAIEPAKYSIDTSAFL